jgi:hypothetical protein
MRIGIRKSWIWVWLIAVGGLAACWGIFGAMRFNEEGPSEPIVPSIASQPGQPLSEEDRRRRLLLGTWEDDYQGKRTMTLREDGAGAMTVELSGLKASLFAPKLEFDLKWSFDDGRLRKQTVGGRPETQVKMILKALGDRVEERVLELTEDRLLLMDPDGQTRYDWRRVKSGP